MDQQAQNDVFESLGRIEANQSALKEALLGPKGRLTRLEDDFTSCEVKVEKLDRVYSYGRWTAIPLVAVLHVGVKHLLSKLGW